MASIEYVTNEAAALGLDRQVRTRASEAPTNGFRGFTMVIKPVTKSLRGVGGAIQARQSSGRS